MELEAFGGLGYQFAVNFFAFFKITRAGQGLGQVQADFLVTGIFFQGFLKLGDGFVHAPLPHQHGGQVDHLFHGPGFPPAFFAGSGDIPQRLQHLFQIFPGFFVAFESFGPDQRRSLISGHRGDRPLPEDFAVEGVGQDVPLHVPADGQAHGKKNGGGHIVDVAAFDTGARLNVRPVEYDDAVGHVIGVGGLDVEVVFLAPFVAEPETVVTDDDDRGLRSPLGQQFTHQGVLPLPVFVDHVAIGRKILIRNPGQTRFLEVSEQMGDRVGPLVIDRHQLGAVMVELVKNHIGKSPGCGDRLTEVGRGICVGILGRIRYQGRGRQVDHFLKQSLGDIQGRRHGLFDQIHELRRVGLALIHGTAPGHPEAVPGHIVARQPAVDGLGGPRRPPADDAAGMIRLRGDVPEGPDLPLVAADGHLGAVGAVGHEPGHAVLVGSLARGDARPQDGRNHGHVAA